MKYSIVLIISLAVSGCVTTTQPPVENLNKTYTVQAEKDKVFDAALLTAQTFNLNVSIIEKDSGFIKFENTSVSARQLDNYCKYPFIKQDGTPYDTFSGWDNRSRTANGGPVVGNIQLTLLILEKPFNTDINIKSNFSVRNNKESQPCETIYRLENNLVREIENNL